jgi:hypothetical protein
MTLDVKMTTGSRLGKRHARHTPGEQQHAQKTAEPGGVRTGRVRDPALIGLAERGLVQHGEVGVDVVEEGADQRLQARGAFRDRRAAVGGRVVVDIGSGARRREGVRVAVALERLQVGRVPAKQDELAQVGAVADEGAQLQMER